MQNYPEFRELQERVEKFAAAYPPHLADAGIKKSPCFSVEVHARVVAALRGSLPIRVEKLMVRQNKFFWMQTSVPPATGEAAAKVRATSVLSDL